MEEFDCVSRTWPGGKVIVSRSVFDDDLVSAKQSKVMGLRRVHLPLRGYLLCDYGSGDKASTQVVFICTVNVASIFSEIAGQLEIPKSLRLAVDDLMNFSFLEKVANAPEDTVGRAPSMIDVFSGFLKRFRSPSGSDVKHIANRRESSDDNDIEFTMSENPMARKAAKQRTGKIPISLLPGSGDARKFEESNDVLPPIGESETQRHNFANNIQGSKMNPHRAEARQTTPPSSQTLASEMCETTVGVSPPPLSAQNKSGSSSWKMAIDKVNNASYFYNEVTMEVSWVRPDGFLEEDL
jgi:hypothetical protein